MSLDMTKSLNILLFQNLTRFIEGATAGILATDSSNIVDLIKENYAVRNIFQLNK